MPERLIARLIVLLGSESVIGIAAKFSNSGAYFVSALLTGIFLDLPHQGLFFTLLSFATLTVVVELGLNTVIIQFTSHETAAVEVAQDEAARRAALSRLRSIGRFAFFWFWAGSGLFLLSVGTGGYFFFKGVKGAGDVLPGPWLAVITLIALDLSLNPFWSILEGARRIRVVYSYRTVKGVAMGLGTAISLASGLGLWSLAIGFLATLPVALWPIMSHLDLFRLFLTKPEATTVGWRSEMMPLQWRLAVSWLAGYCVQWAITPISLKLFGSAIAGQVGMTWALAGGIGTISSAVVMVKSSRFGYFVATRQFVALDRLMLRQGSICWGLSLLGTVFIVLLELCASHKGLHAAGRVLPPDIFAIFLFSAALQQATLPFAVYLRAFKREPYMWLSVAAAVLSLLAFLIGGRYFGIWGVAAGYLVSVCITVPSGTIIFLRCRKAWTSNAA